MKRLKNLTYINIISLLAIALCFSLFVYTAGAVDYADVYTGVLADLQSSAEFKNEDGTLNDVAWSEFLAKYPDDSSNNGFEIITIAESEALELFLYVYQPSHAKRDHVATHINMSLKDPDTIASDQDGGFELYNLVLLSTDGVFDKYAVKDFVVLSDDVRYYNIATIYRDYDSDVDPALPDYNENLVNSTGLEVGKCYVAETHDDTVSYYWLDTEVVTFTSTFVGRIRYNDGYKGIFSSYCDSHFIAFSTDYQIDTLIKVKVDFMERSYSQYKYLTGWGAPSYGDPVHKTLTIDEKQFGTNNADGLFAVKYEWDRIESIDEFFSDEVVESNVSDENKAKVQNEQWVVRFYETVVDKYHMTLGDRYEGTDVSEVTILELTFRTNGMLHTMGVVANRQTGEDDPFIFVGYDYSGILSAILGALVFVALCTVFGPFVGPVWDVIKMIVKYLFLGIWYVISIPFRFLNWLTSLGKGKRR